jgi:hypothetical protein
MVRTCQKSKIGNGHIKVKAVDSTTIETIHTLWWQLLKNPQTMKETDPAYEGATGQRSSGRDAIKHSGHYQTRKRRSADQTMRNAPKNQ